MIHLKRKSTVTTTLRDTYKLVQGFLLKVTTVNDKVTCAALSNPELEKLLKDKAEKQRGEGNSYPIQFYVVKNGEEFRKACAENYFYKEVDGHYWFTKYLIPHEELVEYLKDRELTTDNVFIISNADHTIWDWQGKPIDILVRVGYIGGFQQKSPYHRYDWVKTRAHLRNHPNVSDFEEIEIPSYNADFYGQKAFEFDLIFEGAWREKHNMYANEESIIFSDADPLNIKQFKLEVPKDEE